MTKLPMILLLIAPYFILGFGYLTNTGIGVSILIYAVLLVYTAVHAFRLPKLGFQGKQLLRWNLLLKLLHIPFVLFVFLFVFIISAIGGEAVQDQAVGMVLVAFLLCYLLQLVSAAFGLSGFLWYRRNSLMSKTAMLSATLLQLIPIVDIPVSLLCYALLRKKEPSPEEKSGAA